MEEAGLKIHVADCSVECQEEVVPMYDGMAIQLTNEVDSSDIVGETVVVTTSPELEVEDVKDIGYGGNLDEAEDSVSETNGGQSQAVNAPDAESQGYTSQVSVNCVAVATTLQQLSSGGLWNARGMLEDFTRLRDRLKKQEQRKNPEFRRRETEKAKIRMANRRNDPVLREIERRKDRERRALARQKTGVREKERKRDKVYKKLLRDRAKNVGDAEDDGFISINDNTICYSTKTVSNKTNTISDKTGTVIVKRGTCPVKSRIESLGALNDFQQTTGRDSICEIARKGNGNQSIEEIDDSTETITVYPQKSNSSQVLVDSNRTSGSGSLADSEIATSDTMTKCNHGDARARNPGDTGETVRIISETGEEVVLCTGDAIDEKTAEFIESVILKTSTVHGV